MRGEVCRGGDEKLLAGPNVSDVSRHQARMPAHFRFSHVDSAGVVVIIYDTLKKQASEVFVAFHMAHLGSFEYNSEYQTWLRKLNIY
jgi:hypothetical protein